MDLDRRKFITISGATLSASLLAWLTADPAAAGQITGGRRIGEAAVSHVQARRRAARRAGRGRGGARRGGWGRLRSLTSRNASASSGWPTTPTAAGSSSP